MNNRTDSSIILYCEDGQTVAYWKFTKISDLKSSFFFYWDEFIVNRIECNY